MSYFDSIYTYFTSFFTTPLLPNQLPKDALEAAANWWVDEHRDCANIQHSWDFFKSTLIEDLQNSPLQAVLHQTDYNLKHTTFYFPSLHEAHPAEKFLETFFPMPAKNANCTLSSDGSISMRIYNTGQVMVNQRVIYSPENTRHLGKQDLIISENVAMLQMEGEPYLPLGLYEANITNFYELKEKQYTRSEAMGVSLYYKLYDSQRLEGTKPLSAYTANELKKLLQDPQKMALVFKPDAHVAITDWYGYALYLHGGTYQDISHNIYFAVTPAKCNQLLCTILTKDNNIAIVPGHHMLPITQEGFYLLESEINKENLRLCRDKPSDMGSLCDYTYDADSITYEEAFALASNDLGLFDLRAEL